MQKQKWLIHQLPSSQYQQRTQTALGFPNICGSSQELGKPAKARSASGVASSIRSAAAWQQREAGGFNPYYRDPY